MTATTNARPINHNAGVSLRKKGTVGRELLAAPALVTPPPAEAEPSALVDDTLARRPSTFTPEAWAALPQSARESMLAALAAQPKAAHKVTLIVRPKGQPLFDAKGKPVIEREQSSPNYGKQAVGKGNLLIYGLARNPFTFYPNQIIEILNRASEIRALLDKHRDVLSWGKED